MKPYILLASVAWAAFLACVILTLAGHVTAAYGVVVAGWFGLLFTALAIPPAEETD